MIAVRFSPTESVQCHSVAGGERSALKIYRVSQKNTLSECCWSHSALAQSPVADTPCVLKSIFWSFLTKTMQDQALPSHVHGKIWPHSAQSRL